MDDAGRVLSRAEELAQEFLAGLGARPGWPRGTYEEMLAALGGPLPEEGEDPVAVLEQLAAAADPGLSGSAGPRFFGFVIGGSDAPRPGGRPPARPPGQKTRGNP